MDMWSVNYTNQQGINFCGWEQISECGGLLTCGSGIASSLYTLLVSEKLMQRSGVVFSYIDVQLGASVSQSLMILLPSWMEKYANKFPEM